MKLKKLSLLVVLTVAVFFYCGYPAYCDNSLDGTWKLYTEALTGPQKSQKNQYTVNITQEFPSGRIDGKTVDSADNPLGRVSGLARMTLVEMTFSYQRNVARCTLQLSEDGSLMGGIYKMMDGSSGVIYGLKKQQDEDGGKKTPTGRKIKPEEPENK